MPQNPPVMKSAHSLHRTHLLTGPAGEPGIGKLVVSKRQGIAQMQHQMMCMCCMMSMPVAGALEVSL